MHGARRALRLRGRKSGKRSPTTVALDPGGSWAHDWNVMVWYPTAANAPIDVRDASLVGGIVVVVSLIISLLLVTQA